MLATSLTGVFHRRNPSADTLMKCSLLPPFRLLLALAFFWNQFPLHGELDHFQWNAIPSPVAGDRWEATVTARDSQDQLVEDYTGTVYLSGWQTTSLPALILTEVVGSRNQMRSIELMNPTDQGQRIEGWRITVYSFPDWPSPAATIVIPPFEVCPAGGVFQIKEGQTMSAWSPVFPNYSAGVRLNWLGTTSPLAVMLQDPSGRVIDFMCVSDFYAEDVSLPVAVPPEQWRGPPIPIRLQSSHGYARIGKVDRNNAADWASGPTTPGVVNPGLRLPMAARDVEVLLEPATVTLANGVWTGTMTVGQRGLHMRIRADDWAGHSGESDVFEVMTGPSMHLELPATLEEAQAGATGIGVLQLSNLASEDTNIQLESSLPNEIAVPDSIFVPAGAMSAEFAVTNFDDAMLDGSRTVTIRAAAPGWQSATGEITHLDNETSRLILTAPSAVTKRDIILKNAGRIALEAPAGTDVPIHLSSSHTAYLQVPSMVFIPAGQTSAVFDLTLRDGFLTQPLPVELVARHAGWPSGTTTVTVSDPNPIDLLLGLPIQLFEGTGVTNAGFIMIRAALPTNLTVVVESLNPEVMSVVSPVVIPAGQISTPLEFTVHNNDVVESRRWVQMQAQAEGFLQANHGLWINDDELDHFLFLPTAKSASVGAAPIAITMHAQNLDNQTIPTYAGSVMLQAAGAFGSVPVSPPIVGPFSNGVWTGMVTILVESPGTVLTVTADNGVQSSSAPFDVVLDQHFNVPISDLAYDRFRSTVWAGLLSSAGPQGGSVVPINPANGSMGAPIFLGHNPSKLALADDGRFLYVGCASTGGVARIDLNTSMVDLRFPLAQLGFPGPLFVDDMAVVPGQPNTLLVTRANNMGLAAYDNGVQRSNLIGASTFAQHKISLFDSSFQFYDAYFQAQRRCTLDPNGTSIVLEFPRPSLVDEMKFDGLLLYGASGDVFRPREYLQAGHLAASGRVRTIPEAGRVCYLDQAQLDIFDTSTHRQVGSMTIPDVKGSPLNLIQAGNDRIAFLTSEGQLHLVQTAWLPLAYPTDLSVSQSVAPPLLVVGSPSTYSIQVANHGPAVASHVVIADLLPPEVDFISVTCPGATCSETNGLVSCQVGPLLGGASIVVEVEVRSRAPGPLVNQARVLGGAFQSANDISKATNYCVLDASAPALYTQNIRLSDIAYHAGSRQLYLATLEWRAIKEDSLHTLDLTTGLIGPATPVGSTPHVLSVPDSGRFVYIGVQLLDLDTSFRGPTHVARYRTSTDVIDQVIGFDRFNDLITLPGDDEAYLVARSGSNPDILLFKNGISRRPETPVAAVSLELSRSNPSRLYAISYGPLPYFTRLDIAPNSITQAGSAGGLFTGFGTDIKAASELLFATSGEVVNPDTLTRVTRLPASGLVACDLHNQQVFYLSYVEPLWVLTAFNESTFQPKWSEVIPGIEGNPGRFIPCAPGELAFNTSGGQLFVLNTAKMTGTLDADLNLYLVPSQVTAYVTQYVNITAVIENKGPAPAMEVVVTNMLPAGFLLQKALPSQGTCALENGNVICRLGAMAAAGTAVIDFAYKNPTANSNAHAYAITHAGIDPLPANNLVLSPTVFLPVPKANVAVTLDSNPPSVTVGNAFLITTTVTNEGPDLAQDVSLTQQLPPGAQILSTHLDSGEVLVSGGTIVASLGSLEPGTSVSLLVSVQSTYGGWFMGQASVSTSTADPNSLDNSNVVDLPVTLTDDLNVLQTFLLPSADLAFDPVSQRIYASVTDQGGRLRDSIVALDPNSAQLSSPIPVGERLGQLAISQDGQFLYAARLNTGGVSRVHLPSQTLDLSFGAWPTDGPRYGMIGDMETVPGSPHALAASILSGQDNVASAVWDDGVRRPELGPSGAFGGVYPIAFADPNTLFQTLPFSLRTLRVTGTGVDLLEETANLVPGYETGFRYAGGRIYFANGRVIDPVTKTIIHQIPASGLVVPDPAQDRVYFLIPFGGDPFVTLMAIKAFSATTFAELWNWPVPTLAGARVAFIKLGTQGLAFSNDRGQIGVLHLDRLTPMADLKLEQNLGPNPITTGDTLTVNLSGRNTGPFTVESAVVIHPLPSGGSFVSGATSQGDCIEEEGVVRCDLGRLVSGAAVSFTLKFTVGDAGPFVSNPIISSEQPDPDANNNQNPITLTVLPVSTISVADASLREGNGLTDVRVNLTAFPRSTRAMTVDYQTVDGSARAGVDFVARSGTLAIPAGATNATLTLASTVLGNNLVESNRNFFLNLSNPTLATLERTQAQVTIKDDDYYFISALPVQQPEGDLAAVPLAFAITMQSPATWSVYVDYQTLGGSATPMQDFLPKSGRLLFPAGTTSQLLPVTILGDAHVELDESFQLMLSSDSPLASVTRNEVSGTLLNDDADQAPVIVLVTVSEDAIVLRFRTVLERLYAVQRSASLAPAQWESIGDPLHATAEETDWVDHEPLQGPTAFYRVLLLPLTTN